MNIVIRQYQRLLHRPQMLLWNINMESESPWLEESSLPKVPV